MRGRKSYRDSYVASYTRQFLARQMREFRGDQSQSEFGAKIAKQQTVVSRLEDPNYGKWRLQTLFDVASKLDVAVLVRFVDFSTFLRTTNDRSPSTILPEPYDQQKVDDLASVMEAENHSKGVEAFYDLTERFLQAANENSNDGMRAIPVSPQPSLSELRAS
jgi:hypothetical protein